MLGPTITVAFSVATLPIFAATLAARSEYAPVESRVQVFIWVGALKIAAGSAGTAAAGATTTHAAWVPLVVVSALTVVAATASIVDRSCRR
ncbi:hypothetical protein [Kocuria rosea]|uniref:hypothetical protein n=1 Tax=Kocuria rosea TaxID=1275 RepID=UPI000F6C3B93|nr:hypothetical protein [Kocuria rosea]MEB2528615.1 hypothetical protein [Kocuria rosea]MEB2618857.1 hypothetical protein [Kocuria rosea]VEH43216.1 Uncharacterised protein [Kocuria rosea]